MIRGAIENVTRNRVFGWMWSADADLKGRTVLAFIDGDCVGAGKIENHRPDLEAAGLGDGMAGYNFNLTYPNPADAARVTVKLEGSDVVLVQATSRVNAAGAGGGAARPGGAPARAPLSQSAMLWMRARGWISQSDYDYLRFFRQLGVYDRTLVVPSDRPDKMEVKLYDPAESARHLLLLMRMEEAEVKREALPTARDHRALAEKLESTIGPGAVMAIWSRQRSRLPVIEGSHLQEELTTPGADAPPGTDYAIGPDRLLFIDCRCSLGVGATFPQGGVDVFFCPEP